MLKLGIVFEVAFFLTLFTLYLFKIPIPIPTSLELNIDTEPKDFYLNVTLYRITFGTSGGGFETKFIENLRGISLDVYVGNRTRVWLGNISIEYNVILKPLITRIVEVDGPGPYLLSLGDNMSYAPRYFGLAKFGYGLNDAVVEGPIYIAHLVFGVCAEGLNVTVRNPQEAHLNIVVEVKEPDGQLVADEFSCRDTVCSHGFRFEKGYEHYRIKVYRDYGILSLRYDEERRAEVLDLSENPIFYTMLSVGSLAMAYVNTYAYNRYKNYYQYKLKCREKRNRAAP
ncbi:MAG: hypothetical protein DRO39_02180 [Thermoprotei archaeon]|nr:MAG: hypothetical protein DRO39_02180 [Thermoprotei archaeon]